MSKTPSIAYATSNDVLRFFPTALPYRVQAYVAKVDDEILGLGGLYYPKETRVAFLVLTEEGKKYPVFLCKWVKTWFKKLEADGIKTVIAVADPSIPSAPRFLTHFGFEPLDEIHGQTVYQWHPLS